MTLQDVVGAGAVVLRDVAPNTTVVGNPARVVAERPAGWHDTVLTPPLAREAA
ncbi:MAG: hypothetical protein LC624_02745 [Halobacteriales archaeon]|nr:hypothetical protein [Halobacteriales archaeon]